MSSGQTADALQPLTGGNQGTDTVLASISYTLPNGVENLTLTSGAGSIDGTGNSLDNVIIGNEGNNVIAGKGGLDTLTGGTAADTFVFNTPIEGGATITDFSSGVDNIQVSAAGFGSGLVPGGTVTLVTAASPGAASHAGSAGYFIFDSTDTLWWDSTGGSGSDATVVAKLTGVSTLLPSDFHVV